MKTLILVLSLVAAALAAGMAGPSGAASGSVSTAGARQAPPPAVGRARDLLRGKRFTRFVETGTIGVPSSYDQRLHLCSNGRFIFDEVSNLPEVGTRVARTTGRWRVLSASFGRNGARARIRGVPARGRPLTVTIASNGRRTTIDGNLVIAERSDLCR